MHYVVWQWRESNIACDKLADSVLKKYGAEVHGKQYERYYNENNEALEAFRNRSIGGLKLSDKIWGQTAEHKKSLEAAISAGIERGTSAVTLSKQISQYMNNFDKLRHDYKEKFGKATDIKDCEFASARLARSEINIAYRTAEQKRWEQMDFVVGYRITTSGQHPADDMCDILQGDYPKGFKWTGWHPNCMCYAVPIIKKERAFWDETATADNEITELPEEFNKWLNNNSEKIMKSRKLPYFIEDNFRIGRMRDNTAIGYLLQEKPLNRLNPKFRNTLI